MKHFVLLSASMLTLTDAGVFVYDVKIRSIQETLYPFCD